MNRADHIAAHDATCGWDGRPDSCNELRNEHERGEHSEDVFMDCPVCLDEWGVIEGQRREESKVE